MATNIVFPDSKDPADVDYWTLMFAETIQSISSVVVTETVPAGTNGIWITPGDNASTYGTPLAVQGPPQLTPDMHGVIVKLSDGIPGKAYSVRAFVLMASGRQMARSSVLKITGK